MSLGSILPTLDHGSGHGATTACVSYGRFSSGFPHRNWPQVQRWTFTSDHTDDVILAINASNTESPICFIVGNLLPFHLMPIITTALLKLLTVPWMALGYLTLLPAWSNLATMIRIGLPLYEPFDAVVTKIFLSLFFPYFTLNKSFIIYSSVVPA